MISLKNLDRKLVSKIAIGVLLAIVLYTSISYTVIYFKDRKLQKEIEQIENYKTKIDSLEKRNAILFKEQEILNEKIDSLENVKNKIYYKYGKEIITIYNSSSIDHAEWMDSILKELKSEER